MGMNNPYGTAGEPAYGTTNPPPAAAPAAPAAATTDAAPDQGFTSSNQIDAAFDAAIASAQSARDAASQQLTAAQGAALTLAQNKFADPSTVTSAQRDVDNARSNLNRAETALSTAHERKGQALDTFLRSKYVQPGYEDYLKASAEKEKAAADVSKQQAALYAATNEADRKKALADADEATARAASLGILSPAQAAQAVGAAHESNARANSLDALLPSQVKKGEAEATTAAAEAAVSPQAAQAAVDKAQADANKTQQEYLDLKRQYGLTTDDQVRQSIQTQLDQKQTELGQAQANLAQAQKLMPIAVESAGLGVEQQRQAIARQAQGPLYGVQDQIARYKQLIASGQMTPDAADAAISDYVSRQVTGSTTLEQQTAQNTFNTDTYGKQLDYNRGMAQTAGSFMNQGLGTLTSALGTMTPGHGAEFAGAVSALGGLWNRIGQQYPAPAAPQNAVTSAPVVHINIGGGSPSSTSAPDQGTPAIPPGGALPGATPGQPADTTQPPASNLPAAARPATPDDVMAMWGGAPPGMNVSTAGAAGYGGT